MSDKTEGFVLPDVVDEFWKALIDGDLEGILAVYTDDVCRTGSGPDWFGHGIQQTRDEWVDWLATTPARYTAFRWIEGPYGELGDDFGWASGVGEQDYERDGKIVPQHIRVCWVFKREGSGWKIQMDHWSRPMPEPYIPENAAAKHKPA